MQRLNPKSTPKKTPNRPDRFKTEICRDWSAGNCRRGDRCTFAHGQNELSTPKSMQPKKPTLLCKYHQRGYCSNGHSCRFLHETKTNAGVKGEELWELTNGAAITPQSRNSILEPRKRALQTRTYSSSSFEWPDVVAVAEEPKNSTPLPDSIRKGLDTFSSFSSVAQFSETSSSRFNEVDIHVAKNTVEKLKRGVKEPKTPVYELQSEKSEIETPVAAPKKAEAIRKSFGSPLPTYPIDSFSDRFSVHAGSKNLMNIKREMNEMNIPENKWNEGKFATETTLASQSEQVVSARVLPRIRMLNIANVSLLDLKEMFAAYGYVDAVFINEPENDIADVHFYDLRGAEGAIRYFAGICVDGRPLTMKLLNPTNIDITPSEIKNKVSPVPASFNATGNPSLIRRVYGEESFSDCVLLVHSELFVAHKSVLASSSSFFRQIFTNCSKQDRYFGLNLPGVNSALKDIFDIIYYHQCIIEKPDDGDIVGLNAYLNRALGILRLAEFLGIRVVQRYFAAHLHRLLCAASPCNRCSAFSSIDRLALIELQKSKYAEATPLVEKLNTVFSMLHLE